MKKTIVGLFLSLLVGYFSWQCRANSSNSADAKAAIGQHLFFDKRLSYNNTKSCASCHEPTLAFTDGYHRSIGANGDVHKRNAPSLMNLADNPSFTFTDSSIHSIAQQVLIPLFNQEFMELGSANRRDSILKEINDDPLYKRLFTSSQIKHFGWNDLAVCLEAYCKSITSRQSKFDRVHYGQERFTVDEVKGEKLFFSERLACVKCHGGNDFDQPLNPADRFANNGFFQIDSSHITRKFKPDFGMFDLTKNTIDIGKFKIPSLRNCAVTGPYMHDGRINTLDSVLSIYSLGGNGNVNTHPLIKKFDLTILEKRQLLMFLQTLTDTGYYLRPQFIDPFTKLR